MKEFLWDSQRLGDRTGDIKSNYQNVEIDVTWCKGIYEVSERGLITIGNVNLLRISPLGDMVV